VQVYHAVILQERIPMTQIERAFVDIREGQVHLRRSVGAGPGKAPPLWMVHASPASSVSLVGLMKHLGASRSVIAPDTLGNGDSAPAAPAVPDIAYYAESSLRVMDALGIERVDLYGSHTGAHIVTEMAIARPDRFGRMVLDGIAMFTPEQKKDYLANYAPAIEPDAFGTQFHWAWHFVRDQGWFFPYFKRDAAHLRGLAMPSVEALHNTTLEVLKSVRTYHHAYRAAFAHPDRERLPLVKVPTLVMADSSDPLRGGLYEGATLLPSAVQWIHDDRGDAASLARKAAGIAAFLDTGRLPAA
jgi:pimeloyl-ACP methyl ester carboxylesterase